MMQNASVNAAEDVHSRTSRRIDGFGLLCLALALVFWAFSFLLNCVQRASVVGSFSLLDGFVFGSALALVTHTRKPLLIYLCLGVAILTFVPLFRSWPPGGTWDVTLRPGMPPLLANYFDLLRIALFMLGFPYPFARFGHHAPDAVSNNNSLL